MNELAVWVWLEIWRWWRRRRSGLDSSWRGLTAAESASVEARLWGGEIQRREPDERWRTTSVMKWKKLSAGGNDVCTATWMCVCEPLWVVCFSRDTVGFLEPQQTPLFYPPIPSQQAVLSRGQRRLVNLFAWMWAASSGRLLQHPSTCPERCRWQAGATPPCLTALNAFQAVVFPPHVNHYSGKKKKKCFIYLDECVYFFWVSSEFSERAAAPS